MKFFALVIVAAVLVGVNSSTISEKPKTDLKVFKDACVEETNVDPEKVNHLRNGDFSDRDDELNNFVFCVYKKYGIITDDGTLKKDYIMSTLPAFADREKVSEAIDACMGEKGVNPQERVFFTAKCTHEKKTGSTFFKHL